MARIEQSERRAGPRIEVEVFHSYHHTAEDVRGLPDFMRRIGIYVPEVVGWTPQKVDELNMISRGRVDKKVIRTTSHISEAQRAEHLALYGTKKPVTLVDLPAGYEARENEITTRFNSLTLLARQIIHSPQEGFRLDFDSIMKSAQGMLTRKSDANLQRENHIIEAFEPAIIEVIDTHPQLQRKDTVTVGLQLGVYHTRVSGELGRNFPVRRTFAKKPVIFTPVDQAERTILAGKPLDQTVLAKAVLTSILYHLVDDSNLGDDTNKEMLMIHKITSHFSYEDVQTLIEGYLEKGDTNHYKEHFQQAFLEAKGIAIPTTATELNVFLGIGNVQPDSINPRAGTQGSQRNKKRRKK